MPRKKSCNKINLSLKLMCIPGRNLNPKFKLNLNRNLKLIARLQLDKTGQQHPLLPPWAALLLIVGSLLLAWKLEGR